MLIPILYKDTEIYDVSTLLTILIYSGIDLSTERKELPCLEANPSLRSNNRFTSGETRGDQRNQYSLLSIIYTQSCVGSSDEAKLDQKIGPTAK